MGRIWFVMLLCCISYVQASHTCASSGYRYSDPNHGEICYWIVNKGNDAATSDDKCVQNNGKLAYIPNQGALDVVMNFMNSESESGIAFVGYEKIDDTTLNIQGTGHLQSWFEWDYGQPGGSDQRCIGVSGTSGKWHDYYCDQATIAICSTPFAVMSTTSSTTEVTTDHDVTTEATTVITSEATTVITSEATTVSTSEATTAAIDTTTCHCDCDDSPTYDINPVVNMTKELQEKLDTLRKETEVNEETLSSTIRKRTSVSDPRPSSAYVGYFGIGLLSMIFGGIFLLDLPRVIMVFKSLF